MKYEDEYHIEQENKHDNKAVRMYSPTVSILYTNSKTITNVSAAWRASSAAP